MIENNIGFDGEGLLPVDLIDIPSFNVPIKLG